MSDGNKYINAYIDNAMGMIHEQISLVLQLKTQTKVTGEIIAERDVEIEKLKQDIENLKNELQNSKTNLSSYTEEINSSRANASKWENEVNNLRGQVDQINTFTAQIRDMKVMIIDKDQEIAKLKAKLETPKPVKTAAKKDINKKESNGPKVNEKEQVDDF